MQFSPLAVADLYDRVCKAAESGGRSIAALATSVGLGDPVDVPSSVGWALHDGATVWRVPANEAQVFLFSHGDNQARCGTIIVRPLAEVTSLRVIDQMASRGFAVEKKETLSPTASFTRLKSTAGRYVDMLEYAPSGDTPGVLRIDIMPAS